MTSNFDVNQFNGLALAYMGDAVLEQEIRNYLLTQKQISKVNDLQSASKKFVSAKAQAAIFSLMEQDQFLTTDELAIFKRGRNSQIHTKAKNTDVITYKISTGIEALIGYLFLSGHDGRLKEVIHYIIENNENGRTRP